VSAIPLSLLRASVGQVRRHGGYRDSFLDVDRGVEQCDDKLLVNFLYEGTWALVNIRNLCRWNEHMWEEGAPGLSRTISVT
jgi:hypothetical protein